MKKVLCFCMHVINWRAKIYHTDLQPLVSWTYSPGNISNGSLSSIYLLERTIPYRTKFPKRMYPAPDLKEVSCYVFQSSWKNYVQFMCEHRWWMSCYGTTTKEKELKLHMRKTCVKTLAFWSAAPSTFNCYYFRGGGWMKEQGFTDLAKKNPWICGFCWNGGSQISS